jgi:hypothetical protein
MKTVVKYGFDDHGNKIEPENVDGTLNGSVGILYYDINEGLDRFTFYHHDEIELAQDIMESGNLISSILNIRNNNKYICRLCEWRLKNRKIKLVYGDEKSYNPSLSC